jgi:hypothetical protein
VVAAGSGWVGEEATGSAAAGWGWAAAAGSATEAAVGSGWEEAAGWGSEAGEGSDWAAEVGWGLAADLAVVGTEEMVGGWEMGEWASQHWWRSCRGSAGRPGAHRGTAAEWKFVQQTGQCW